MKKRISSIMLTICMVLMVVPISVNAMSLNVNLSIIGKADLTLNVESGDSIANVKEKIKTETELPVTDQILKYEGEVLEDGRTLADYNIQKESTIELSLAESIPEGLEYTISDAGEVTITKYNGSDTAVDIPKQIEGKNVTSIGESAFYRCKSLTSITIPNSVTSIGDSAFEKCTSLENINIPNSVTSIGKFAFDGCTSLKIVTIPASVKSIGYGAFACTSLTSIDIPNSVTSIGNSAFYSCTSLTSIDIPNSVISIGNDAFGGCTSLTSINIPNSVTSIGNSAFYGCASLTSIDIPNSVTSIKNWTFYNCRSLTSIDIPNSVISIGNDAFGGCTSLISIFLSDNVTSIGVNAIPDTTTKVKYSLNTDKKEVTITEIDLGTDKNIVDIPDTICGYSVVAVATSEQSKVGAHTCKGGTATYTAKALCALCGKEYGEVDSSNNKDSENNFSDQDDKNSSELFVADKDTISTNPQTGDNIIMSIIIFALALTGILGIFIINKKKVKNNK